MFSACGNSKPFTWSLKLPRYEAQAHNPSKTLSLALFPPWKCFRLATSHQHVYCTYHDVHASCFQCVSLPSIYFSRIRLQDSSCCCSDTVCVWVHEKKIQTSWFTGLHKHRTNPNLMWANPLFPRATSFRPLVPLIEKYKRLWGQQIHCSRGATSESSSSDLSMVLVSNKLSSNQGYLVWLGAICAGIINWPNSDIYEKTCALSSLKLFVEAKRAVQGSCSKLLWLSTRMMNFQGKAL